MATATPRSASCANSCSARSRPTRAAPPREMGFLVNATLPDICVVGLGYIGLPTAAILAARGLRVVGLDINARIVEAVNRGAVHITEPDLAGLVQGVVASGMLRAVTQAVAAKAFV